MVLFMLFPLLLLLLRELLLHRWGAGLGVALVGVLAVQSGGGVVLVVGMLLVRRHRGAHRVVLLRGWGGRGGLVRGRGDGGGEMGLLVHLGHGHCFVVVGVDDAGGALRGGGGRHWGGWGGGFGGWRVLELSVVMKRLCLLHLPRVETRQRATQREDNIHSPSLPS